ncbi:hypothetical protein A3Q56_07800 [Intoshia linei]|uniref:Uncharacterized protein n=1 Tax=Intoshia linei TaxID=1819745 RepID=A0A177ASY4_9BILA|nr:hypothetical protein A3Q56_07800 [Intoshia linei]
MKEIGKLGSRFIRYDSVENMKNKLKSNNIPLKKNNSLMDLGSIDLYINKEKIFSVINDNDINETSNDTEKRDSVLSMYLNLDHSAEDEKCETHSVDDIYSKVYKHEKLKDKHLNFNFDDYIEINESGPFQSNKSNYTIYPSENMDDMKTVFDDRYFDFDIYKHINSKAILDNAKNNSFHVESEKNSIKNKVVSISTIKSSRSRTESKGIKISKSVFNYFKRKMFKEKSDTKHNEIFTKKNGKLKENILYIKKVYEKSLQQREINVLSVKQVPKRNTNRVKSTSTELKTPKQKHITIPNTKEALYTVKSRSNVNSSTNKRNTSREERKSVSSDRMKLSMQCQYLKGFIEAYNLESKFNQWIIKSKLIPDLVTFKNSIFKSILRKSSISKKILKKFNEMQKLTSFWFSLIRSTYEPARILKYYINSMIDVSDTVLCFVINLQDRNVNHFLLSYEPPIQSLRTFC